MPEDSVSGPVTPFATARAAVAAWLASLGVAVEIGGADLNDRYPGRGFASGWRLSVKFADGVRRLELLLPIGFPWQPPRVALLDRPPFLTWPHVEHDGVLCLAPNTLEIDPDCPADAVSFMLKEAEEAVNKFIAGACENDFRDEFATYWQWASDAGPRVISLLRPASPTRSVQLWRGKDFYLIGETHADVRQWLTNLYGKAPDSFDTVAAGFLWLGEPPIPGDYPGTATALRSLVGADNKEATALLMQLAHDRPDKMVVALGVDTANGPAMGGVIIPSPRTAKHGPRDPLTKGFRPDAVPNAVLFARYFGAAPLTRRPIERADAAWVHGRGQDSRATLLRAKCVVVIGCGSVGAAVAITLAQAGVGRIILVDFDTLAWANIGRHPLGGRYVDQSKAKALAEKLRADFPHTTIEYHITDAGTVVREQGALLGGADLILAATGSWAAESRLDAWHAATGRAVPIVYGWTEPHACAAHALLLVGRSACLRCGFDGTGMPAFRVTAWPNGSATRQEPACGAVYQPYGPVELGYVNSLIGELALDILLGEECASTHRIWIGNAKRMSQLGGMWTSEWKGDPEFRDTGDFIAQRPWPSRSCPRCAEAQAA